MATKIVTKNSSTASAVPTTSDLVQGELAVNVADKRLFTEDNGGAIVELGTNPSTLTVTGEITANGGIALGDNDKATFGASDDLEIYHDGTRSLIRDSGTGNLLIRATDLSLQNADGATYASFTSGGAGIFNHNNSTKLATTSTGIDVTGTATVDGLTSSSTIKVDHSGALPSAIQVGDPTTLASDTGVYFRTTGIAHLTIPASGNLCIDGTSNQKFANFSGNGDISFYEDTGTTAKLFWDASAESLGIGSTPNQILTLDKASGDVFTRFDKGGAIKGLIGIADSAASGSSGSVQGDMIVRGQTNLLLDTAGTTRVKVDASGNVLVGQTSADSTSNGHGLLATGRAYHTMASAHPLQLNRKTSDGEILRFQKDGSTVGSIGTSGNYLSIGDEDTAIRFHAGVDTVLPHNSSTNATRDAAISLGSSGGRFKDLYLSGGVYLGGTGAANKLDDYEEGTWTPSLDASSTDPSLSYAVQVGAYEKIGALVHASFFINVSAVNSQGSGTLRIAGLPFNASNNINASEVPAVMLQTEPFNAGDGAGYQQFARTAGNTNVLLMGYKTGNGGSSIPAGANNVGTGYLIGHIVYRTLA